MGRGNVWVQTFRPDAGSLLAQLIRADDEGRAFDVDFENEGLRAPLLRYPGLRLFRADKLDTYPVFSDAAIRQVLEASGNAAMDALKGKLQLRPKENRISGIITERVVLA